MEKSIDSVRRNFNTVRTGRANVSILDRIQASLARRSSRGAVAEPVAQAAAHGFNLLRFSASASGAEASYVPCQPTSG